MVTYTYAQTVVIISKMKELLLWKYVSYGRGEEEEGNEMKLLELHSIVLLIVNFFRSLYIYMIRKQLFYIFIFLLNPLIIFVNVIFLQESFQKKKIIRIIFFYRSHNVNVGGYVPGVLYQSILVLALFILFIIIFFDVQRNHE